MVNPDLLYLVEETAQIYNEVALPLIHEMTSNLDDQVFVYLLKQFH